VKSEHLLRRAIERSGLGHVVFDEARAVVSGYYL
jgi:hypothetical protein